MSKGIKIAATALLMSFAVQTNAAANSKSHPCISGPERSSTITALDKRKRTFQLSGSKQNYALAGLEIPYPSNEFKVGDSISIYGLNQQADRYGVIHVQAIKNGQKTWLQGDLLRNGAALLNGSSENTSPKCLASMRSVEHKAIASQVGLWSQKQTIFTVDQIDQLTSKSGSFAVVEGKVVSVGDRKRRLYLNFGQNWSQDFTLSVVKTGKGAFKGSLNLLTGLKGKTIRVRGVLEVRQGPLIRLFDEAQIEIIEK